MRPRRRRSSLEPRRTTPRRYSRYSHGYTYKRIDDIGPAANHNPRTAPPVRSARRPLPQPRHGRRRRKEERCGRHVVAIARVRTIPSVTQLDDVKEGARCLRPEESQQQRRSAGCQYKAPAAEQCTRLRRRKQPVTGNGTVSARLHGWRLGVVGCQHDWRLTWVRSARRAPSRRANSQTSLGAGKSARHRHRRSDRGCTDLP